MLPTKEDVDLARDRIRSRVRRTPVKHFSEFDKFAGVETYFKCENEQVIGAFKARGAYNAVAQLDPAVKEVVTHSSGNHGAALAWAAKETGRRATIVCPVYASPIKRDAILKLGAQIVDCDPDMSSREEVLKEYLVKHEAHFIHPYDDFNVIAGQGTAVCEFLEQAPPLSQVWVPVGGGGLVSGTLIGAEGACEVLAGEPELARDAHDSLHRDRIQPPLPVKTIADGLRSGIGKMNFQIMQEHQLEIQLVSEEEIVSSMEWLRRNLNLVIEPSSAVPVAALLKNVTADKGPVGVILSGGNV